MRKPIFVVRWGQERPTSFASNRPQHLAAYEETGSNWLTAARAAESKKAQHVVALDLREVTSFTDFFVICSIANPRQGKAVCDEVHKQLKALGELPVSMEGYDQADWILMDYGDFLVHIFSEHARSYYGLERLWGHAKTIALEESA